MLYCLVLRSVFELLGFLVFYSATSIVGLSVEQTKNPNLGSASMLYCLVLRSVFELLGFLVFYSATSIVGLSVDQTKNPSEELGMEV